MKNGDFARWGKLGPIIKSLREDFSAALDNLFAKPGDPVPPLPNIFRGPGSAIEEIPVEETIEPEPIELIPPVPPF
jgi:hypothetical protein